MRRSRGFTLVEAIISILILSVVMIVALTLLVSMRSFAAKQQAMTAPRQSARAAIDYISFFLASATDLNHEFGNPNALVMWTQLDNSTTPQPPRQASYNNLTAAQAGLGYGDEGTDIISMAIPTNPVRIPVMQGWTGNTPAGITAYLNYSAGCGPLNNQDAANLDMFKKATGAGLVGGVERSGLLTVQDSGGRWRYLQITRYVSSTCAEMTGTDPTRKVILIEFIPGTTTQLNPPGGWRGDFPEAFVINAGVEYTSFRVRNGNLEQKTTGRDPLSGVLSPGFFDPACDGTTKAAGCPSIGFTPVVENVEDLQVAYVFQNGQIWNTGAAGFVLGTTGKIPEEAQTDPLATPGANDIANVRALRVSVIARSNPLDIGARGLSVSQTAGTYRRVALEDHAEGPADTVATGVFDRYRLTTTLALRNRMLGY